MAENLAVVEPHETSQQEIDVHPPPTTPSDPPESRIDKILPDTELVIRLEIGGVVLKNNTEYGVVTRVVKDLNNGKMKTKLLKIEPKESHLNESDEELTPETLTEYLYSEENEPNMNMKKHTFIIRILTNVNFTEIKQSIERGNKNKKVLAYNHGTDQKIEKYGEAGTLFWVNPHFTNRDKLSKELSELTGTHCLIRKGVESISRDNDTKTVSAVHALQVMCVISNITKVVDCLSKRNENREDWFNPKSSKANVAQYKQLVDTHKILESHQIGIQIQHATEVAIKTLGDIILKFNADAKERAIYSIEPTNNEGEINVVCQADKKGNITRWLLNDVFKSQAFLNEKAPFGRAQLSYERVLPTKEPRRDPKGPSNSALQTRIDLVNKDWIPKCPPPARPYSKRSRSPKHQRANRANSNRQEEFPGLVGGKKLKTSTQTTTANNAWNSPLRTQLDPVMVTTGEQPSTTVKRKYATSRSKKAAAKFSVDHRSKLTSLSEDHNSSEDDSESESESDVSTSQDNATVTALNRRIKSLSQTNKEFAISQGKFKQQLTAKSKEIDSLNAVFYKAIDKALAQQNLANAAQMEERDQKYEMRIEKLATEQGSFRKEILKLKEDNRKEIVTLKEENEYLSKRVKTLQKDNEELQRNSFVTQKKKGSSITSTIRTEDEEMLDELGSFATSNQYESIAPMDVDREVEEVQFETANFRSSTMTVKRPQLERARSTGSLNVPMEFTIQTEGWYQDLARRAAATATAPKLSIPSSLACAAMTSVTNQGNSKRSNDECEENTMKVDEVDELQMNRMSVYSDKKKPPVNTDSSTSDQTGGRKR
jgi:hypothetical protein